MTQQSPLAANSSTTQHLATIGEFASASNHQHDNPQSCAYKHGSHAGEPQSSNSPSNNLQLSGSPSADPQSRQYRHSTQASGETNLATTPFVVQLQDIGFSYDRGASWTLEHLSLSIAPGEYVALVGANGSGKSTLGRIIAGLTTPDYGSVKLCGIEVYHQQADPDAYRQAKRQIGVVFQQPDDQLVATVVEDDVAFGPENLRIQREEIRQRVDTSLEQVGLADRAQRNPLLMSGGQQQRVAIAGMLAMHSTLLVLDEPCAMLDARGRQEVLDLLGKLHDQGTTIVHITHSFEEAQVADRIIALNHGIPREISKSEAAQLLKQEPVATTTTKQYHGQQDLPEITATPSQAESTPALWHAQHNPDIPALSASHLSYRFAGMQTPTLDDVSITVMPGTITAIRGENGSGKSTLARILSGIYTPQTGNIDICGLPFVTERGNGSNRHSVKAKRKLREQIRRHIGYVMQHPEHQLFASSVAEDVAFGPRNMGLNAQEVEQRVHQSLALVGIEHLAETSPFSLSGGQQRLVAIAGVLACQPDIVIWDEPTSSLDATATARVHAIMLQLKRLGVASVIITHHSAEYNLADQVIEMHKVRPIRPQTEERHTSSPSILQTLDPRATLVSTLALMFTTFAVNSPLALAITGAVCMAMMLVSRTSPQRLLRSIHPFIALFAVMWVCNLWFTQEGNELWSWGVLRITDTGLWLATLYFCRLVAVLAIGAMLILATSTVALIDAMQSLFEPLRKLGWHTDELALVASLALRFVPTLGRETRDITYAQATRGGSVDAGSLPQRLQAMAAIVVPIFAGSLRHAHRLALALDARCYEGGTGRTHLHSMKFTWKDALYVSVVLLDIVAIVCCLVLL